MKKRIVIIGGGASGLTAAIAAARAGASVTIIEHMDRVGKKILSTGNGRCNLTNRRMDKDCYRSSRKDFPLEVIGGFGVNETLDFFRELGIEPKDRNGYIYPYSDQASAVLDVLRSEISRLGVFVLLSCQVKEIRAGQKGGFQVDTDQGMVEGEALILAAGSKAAPSTGSDGSGYELAKKLGHSVIKPLPALVQLRCQGNLYRQMAGIRTEARVKVFGNGGLLAEDQGELQLTDYGLSGIPVFQISRFASKALDQGHKVCVLVDFMPSWEEETALERLTERAGRLGYKTAEELFTGLLNKKLALVLLKLAGILPEQKAGSLSAGQLRKLVKQMKSYEAIVMSVNPFANAQVCCGGVDTREVDSATMESRLRKNLYFAGEILDVDGICGGYNLQFAWSSGMLAGRAAAEGSQPGRKEDRLPGSQPVRREDRPTGSQPVGKEKRCAGSQTMERKSQNSGRKGMGKHRKQKDKKRRQT